VRALCLVRPRAAARGKQSGCERDAGRAKSRAVSDSLESETALDSLRLTRFLRRTGSHFAGKRSLAPHARAAGVQVAPNMRRKDSWCEDVGRSGATNRRRVVGLRGELALRALLFARVVTRAMTD
jgi:hypothetical protein